MAQIGMPCRRQPPQHLHLGPSRRRSQSWRRNPGTYGEFFAAHGVQVFGHPESLANEKPPYMTWRMTPGVSAHQCRATQASAGGVVCDARREIGRIMVTLAQALSRAGGIPVVDAADMRDAAMSASGLSQSGPEETPK